MQRGTILIWGYAGTKRLRTPAVSNSYTHAILGSVSFGSFLKTVKYLCKCDFGKLRKFAAILVSLVRAG
jgi:hypothetical protein